MKKPTTDTHPAIIHPIWLRLCHWINALAMLIMVTSGWRIYNASPLFNFNFMEELTLGGWPGGALQWHFTGMWLFGFNAMLYLLLNSFTGRFQKNIGHFQQKNSSLTCWRRCAVN